MNHWPPLKSDLGEFAESLLRKLFGDRELLDDKAGAQLLDTEPLTDVFQAPEAESRGFASHTCLDHSLTGDKGLIDSLIAPAETNLSLRSAHSAATNSRIVRRNGVLRSSGSS